MSESDEDENPEVVNDQRRKMFGALSMLAGGAVLGACAPGADGSPRVGVLDPALHGDASIHYADVVADLVAMDPGVPRRFCILSGYWSRGDGGGGLFYWDKDQLTANANGGTIFAPTAASVSGCWMRIFDGDVSVKWFGATGDGQPPPSGSNVSYFTKAMHSLSPTVVTNGGGLAPTVFVPPGRYLMTSTLVIDRTVVLRGAGGGYVSPTTILSFAGLMPGDDGVQVLLRVTDPVSGEGRGDFSIIRDLSIQGDTGGGHAVHIMARSSIENCYITAFGGDGIHIEASHPESLANGWRVRNVRVTYCGGHGLFTRGGDVNAGSAIDVDIGQCLGWGIYDSSFLGNTYVACQVDSINNPAGLGAYKSDSATATNLFLGCYAESGGANEIASPSMVIGGVLSGSGNSGNGGVLAFDGPSPIFLGGSWVSGLAQSENATPTVSANIGGPSILRLTTGASPDLGWYTTLDYGSLAPGWWSMRHQANISYTAFAFSTFDAAEGPGNFWMPKGYYLGFGPPYGTAFHVGVQNNGSTMSTPPTYVGKPGERVLNATPLPGDWEGYVWCVGFGWKGYGLIQS